MCRVPVLVSSTCYGMCVPCLLPSCSASQTSDRVTPADCFQFDTLDFKESYPPRGTHSFTPRARGGGGGTDAPRGAYCLLITLAAETRESLFFRDLLPGAAGTGPATRARQRENRRYGLCTCSMRVTQTRPTHRDQGRDRRVHTGDTATTRRARGQTGQGAHSHSHRSRILTPALGSRKRTRNHQ